MTGLENLLDEISNNMMPSNQFQNDSDEDTFIPDLEEKKV
jgi:hypothetical protein